MSRLLSLLAGQTERYTVGESTSVTVETAQELLASFWHTLTVAMDESHTPYTRLLTDDLLPVVKRGQTILQDRLAKTKRLWEGVCQTAPGIQNFTMSIRSVELVTTFSTTIYTFLPTKSLPALIIRS